ncbi:MAG: DUF4398 domain-containing protein [Polyangiaceae bacterium]
MRLRLRHVLAVSAVTTTLAFGTGCGGVYYAATVNAASSRVEEAREVGAEQWAPYEFYYARAHLEQAMHEASTASYSDAADYAETAEDFAVKAIDATKAARNKAEARKP